MGTSTHVHLLFQGQHLSQDFYQTFLSCVDCCHSGTILDGKEVIISGRKDGKSEAAETTGVPDLMALAGIFGLKDLAPGLIKMDEDKFRNRWVLAECFVVWAECFVVFLFNLGLVG